jgi:CBS domain containing-hemolysin-like protein
MIIFVAAVATALVVSFLCSIFESVLLSLSPVRVEALVNEGKRSGRILREFKANIDVPIAAILIVNTIAHTIGATVAGARYADVFSEQSLWVFSLVFTLAVLLLTEIIPKTLGVTFAARLASPVAYAIHYLTLMLKPLVWIASRISKALRGNHEASITSIEDIRLLAAIGRNEGVVGIRAASIIDGATRLHQLDAADVLLPRGKVIMLSEGQDRAAVLSVLHQSGHSRFPFSPTGRADDISGVVLAKELLVAVLDNQGPVPWDDIVRETLFVPETMPLSSLLQVFRSAQKHIAVVVDEYGGTQGIVTLEDVFEELVGEIQDESDQPLPEMLWQPDGTLRVPAMVELRKLETELGVDWDHAEDVVTLSGLLLILLDRIPVNGDVVVWQGHRFEIESALATRANVVLIRRIRSSAPESSNGED